MNPCAIVMAQVIAANKIADSIGIIHDKSRIVVSDNHTPMATATGSCHRAVNQPSNSNGSTGIYFRFQHGLSAIGMEIGIKGRGERSAFTCTSADVVLP